MKFLEPEGGSESATLVVLLDVEISENPQGFLNTQRSATKLCTNIRAHICYRSTASDF